MPTWLVTGGAGFIGGNFVLEAVARGIKVVNLDALTYAGNLKTLSSLDGNPNHVFVQGDIGDRALVARLLAEHQPDAVLNFAAESHVDRSIDGPGAFIQTNVVGTLGLLEAVRDYWKALPADRGQAFRFLHVSTDEVYGTLGETGKFTETTPYAPNSPYSASKAASDHLVRAFHHTYGLPVLTTKASQMDLEHGLGSGSVLNEKRIDKSVGLDWTWERGNKRALRTLSAQRAADAAQADVDDTRVMQLQAGLTGFYDLLAAQERLAEVRAISQSASQLAGTAAQRVRAGDLAAQDAARTEIEAQPDEIIADDYIEAEVVE